MFDHYTYLTLPWLRAFAIEEEGRWVVKKSITHVLLFPEQNISVNVFRSSSVVITLTAPQAADTPVLSSNEEMQSSLHLESVLATIRRFHSRYNSCLAVLLYFFDLQVDRMMEVTMKFVTQLKGVEDSIILNDTNQSFISLYRSPDQIRVETLLSLFTNLEKVNSIVGGCGMSEE